MSKGKAKRQHHTWSIHMHVQQRTTYTDSNEVNTGHYSIDVEGVPTLYHAVSLALDSLYERWPEVADKLRPLHKARRKAAMRATKDPRR